MIRPILKYPAPELQQTCEVVTTFNGEVKALAADMVETMYSAPGIGLAAPQVGVTIRLIVVDPTAGEAEGHQFIIVNPEVVEVSGTQREEEGCLSLPGLTAVVQRPGWVRVRGMDLDGQEIEIEGSDLMARLLCNEIDHLDGVLYLDRVSALKRDLLKRKIRKLIRAGEW